MRYKMFGPSGLRVSEVALGTGTFGTSWGWGAERAESKLVFDAFAKAGGTFIDSADVYQFGEAESFLGEFLAAEREHFVLATKYTLGSSPQQGVSRTGNSRKNMVRSVEASLRSLQTDRIDLYWVHMSDELTPVDEIVRGFDDLVRSGKVLYVGISDFPAWRIARAATITELRGWTPIVGVQLEYSLAERTPERELLPMAKALGLGATLWSPLGGGLLTGKYRAGGVDGRLTKGGGPVRAESGKRETAIVDALDRVAHALGVTPAQVAIAWLRAKAAERSNSLVPILGARTAAQLADNLSALELQLTTDQVRDLDEVSAVPLGFPHEMLASERYSSLTAGGIRDAIDRPAVPVA